MSQQLGFSGSLWAHLAPIPPVLTVLYGGESELEEVLAEIELLCDVPSSRETSSEAALGNPHTLVLLTVPLDRQEYLIDLLETQRDRLQIRTQPLVLLLPRSGVGVRRLFRSPFLASWLRGRILDPERLNAIDVEDATSEFLRQAGCAPEEFLRQWNSQTIADTLENNLLHQQALMLAQEQT